MHHDSNTGDIDRALRIIPITRRRKIRPKKINSRPATPRIIVTPVRNQVPKKIRVYYPQKKRNIPPPPPVPANTTPYTTSRPKLNLKGYDETLKAFERQKTREIAQNINKEIKHFESLEKPFNSNPPFADEPLKTIDFPNKNTENIIASQVTPVLPAFEDNSAVELNIPDFPYQPSFLDNLNLEFGAKLSAVKTVKENSNSNNNKNFVKFPSSPSSSTHFSADTNANDILYSTTTPLPSPSAPPKYETRNQFHENFHENDFTKKFVTSPRLPVQVEQPVRVVLDDNKWHPVQDPIIPSSTTLKPIVTSFYEKNKPLKTIDDYNNNNNGNSFETIQDYNKGTGTGNGKLFNNDVQKLLVQDPYAKNPPDKIYQVGQYVEERLDTNFPDNNQFDEFSSKLENNNNQFDEFSPDLERLDPTQMKIPRFPPPKETFSYTPLYIPVEDLEQVSEEHAIIDPYKDFQVPGTPPNSYDDQILTYQADLVVEKNQFHEKKDNNQNQFKRDVLSPTDPGPPYREDFEHYRRTPKVNYFYNDPKIIAASTYHNPPPVNSYSYFNQEYFDDVKSFESDRSRKLELPAIATDNFPHIVEHISTYGITRPAASGRSLSVSDDIVDFGAATGGNGAFGWYTDHPVIQEGLFH